jgi:putative transposase
MFSPELEAEAIDDIRLALNQGQPLGNARFIDSIERTTGVRREPRPRGRPRKSTDA